MMVCHIASLHPPLDVRIFHKECKTISQAGYDVTLLAQADWAEQAVHGIRIIGLPRVTRRRERPRVWQQVVHHVRRLKPDLVHFHDPALLLIAPLLRPAKLIYDCQEPYAETVLVRRWIPRRVRQPVSWLVGRLEPTLARRTDAVVVTMASHADRFLDGEQPVVVVRNYPLMSSLDFNRHSDGRTLLHVGILSHGRGATVMIEAVNLLIRRVEGVRLTLVGSFDSPEDEAEVRRLIAALCLEKAVELTGWVPFSDLPQWFARGDVGLVPWRSVDEFPPPIVPTKIFEYMGSRLPVVASDRPEIAQVMMGLDCGLLVPPGDPQELAAAVEYLLTNPIVAREMGIRGQDAVRRLYHWSTEGERLLALYRQLTETDKGSV